MPERQAYISAVRHTNGTRYAVAWSNRNMRDALIDRMIASLESAAYIDETRVISAEALPTASASNIAYWRKGAFEGGAMLAVGSL